MLESRGGCARLVYVVLDWFINFDVQTMGRSSHPVALVALWSFYLLSGISCVMVCDQGRKDFFPSAATYVVAMTCSFSE